MYLQEKEVLQRFLNEKWLQKINHPLLLKHGLHADMLRLDLIHPQISGNKWLKLQYWLQHYTKGKYKGLLTLGGPWSNHVHATAFACSKAGIPCTIWIKGHENLKNPMLTDIKQWGASLHFVSRSQFYNSSQCMAFAEDHQLLAVPIGGDGPEGIAGVKHWFDNMELPAYDWVGCAIGSGTTLAGIAASRLKSPVLWGFNPGTGDAGIAAKVADLQVKHTARLIQYYNNTSKMGKPSPALLKHMLLWYGHTGIPLDVVYTGPMCQYIIENLDVCIPADAKKILLIHTGGLQGNRSQPGLPVH